MFVFPMCGSSERFRKEGILTPKFMLEAKGRPLFQYALLGFKHYFESHPFVFVVRSNTGGRDFVISQCVELGIRQFEVIELENPTSGQGETVALGLSKSAIRWTGPMSIFNIDTFRREFRLPEFAANPATTYAGYLEVFRGAGDNWSFVRVSDDGARVVEVREKKRISDLCSTGFYHFRDVETFFRAFHAPFEAATHAEQTETYVAPLYNHLIREGLWVRLSIIDPDDVCFCGVPTEYRAFLESSWSNVVS